MMEIETVPCRTCAQPTTMLGTKQCNNCWEVECRLRDYAKSEGGKVALLRALNDAGFPSIDVSPLKRWIGKERARFDRINANSTGCSKERAFGEGNVCTLILGKINTELGKLRRKE